MLLKKLGSISNFNVHVWGSCVKPSYADQLEDLIIELKNLRRIIELENQSLLGRLTLSAEATEGKLDEVSSNLKLLTLSVESTEGKLDEIAAHLIKFAPRLTPRKE
ncbi:hypothetical protein RchiOBHm_Chr1g0337831 [Rosa chinensis]|uniref:Uncharacterized protein n=1 Tax=Rosa chinensis TaxID=74649 RepID=A0A2P6SD16_ROSCH|nr:hypothetical protein RchiOBHm_Chr1g0337831 [Rosa chinensis]